MIPGQVHSWSFEADVDGYVINFSPEFFQSFLLKPGYLEQFQFFTGNVEKSVIDLPKELESVIKLYFDELIRESETGEPYAQDMVKAILLQIFMTVGRLNFSRQQSSAHSSYSFTLFRNFQSLIERHYENLRLPKEYAELMSITPNHLNAVCRDYLGIPAGEVIRKRVILEAKRLLVNPDFSVSEIAYKLNFDDNSYFTKFFRKQAAVTPEEFRKKALNLVQKQNNQLK
jgi:AraC-like DNA-binding protein